MKRKSKTVPHVIILPESELLGEIKDHKARDFYGLLSLRTFRRSHDKFQDPRYTHKQLGARMGIYPRYVRRMLDVLEIKGSIKREMQEKLEVTTISMIADKDTKESVLVLRVGDKQFEHWRQAGGAMRTACMLGLHTDENGMILNGNQPLAKFISDKVGVSVSTAYVQMKKLKDAEILFGYHDRKGLRRNQKQWFIDRFIMYYIDRGKRLAIE